MESRNGRRVARTTSERGPLGLADAFLTKGLRIGFERPTPMRDDWACAAHPDPTVFDPVDDDAHAEALTWCATCPAREACLELGLARGEWGVWGGVLLEAGAPLERPRRPGRPKRATRGAA